MGATDEVARYASYLQLLARQQLDDRLSGKVDIETVVNQTLYEVGSRLGEIGEDEAGLLSWLHRVLRNNLIDEIRKVRKASHDATRDVSLEKWLDESSRRICLLASDITSPSQKAAKNEALLRLTEALAQLPDRQRRAVELHHLQGLSLVETAAKMGSSDTAVAGLVFRGLTKLRELLEEPA